MVTRQQAHQWLVMVDGSQTSQDGLKMVCKSLKKLEDQIVACHIYDSYYTQLPQQNRSQSIKKACESLLAQTGQTSNVVTQRMQIIQIADLLSSDIIVMGFGKKGSETERSGLKQRVDRSIRNINTNVLIVRNEVLRTAQKGFYWICCVDPSTSSEKGFNLMTTLYQQGDKVKVAYVFNKAKNSEAEETKQKYEKLLDQAQITGTFEKVQMKGADTKIDTLIEFLKQEQPDFITCGSIGCRRSYQEQRGSWDFSKIGSATESIINLTDSNVLMASLK